VLSLFGVLLGEWLLNDRAVLLLEALHGEGANLIAAFVRWL
jgi:hypothetical protein